MGTSNAALWGPAEREARRMQAADLFEQGVRQVRVARLLGVSRQAVGQWHAAWRAGGREALVARPNGSRSYLTPQQEQELLRVLRLGASAHGWEGQGWTLSRIARVIEERFGVRFTVPGVWYLMDRLGWSWQVPKTQAVQRDEEAITAWRTQTWPAVSHPGKR
ncbi:winged helix-turn-helix domain-containing protein [Streptomyces sp. NBC_01549]|uniref:winged helix-turn-helix domain-containing protein n=1 Tax=unclassified Streptomyces TaxID=2593676 RepID=UPI00225903D5|nr:winged helix-turn-helix domain-containing protein [Streptomyces sp. NBC_01549]MCX4598359.1 winged helix-turn-helix domain-containing protein [Streptomyces sp. NBC_01549]